MKVLERAAGHASGPYHLPERSTSTATAVRTNNPVCGAFRGFGANQAQFAMEGVHGPPRGDWSASPAGRSASATSSTPARCGDLGQIMDDGCRGRGGLCLDRSEAAHTMRRRPSGKAVGLGLGPEELGPRQRASSEVSKAGSCASSTTPPSGHRSTSRRTRAPSRSATAGPRWARVSTPSPCRSQSTELGIDPTRIKVIVDTTRDLGHGPDHRQRAARSWPLGRGA